MIFYKSKDLTQGLKIEINNEPYIILEVNFVNMGRGQAFNKLKIKNILTNTLIIKTFKINEKLKEANIYTKELKFLYYTDKCNYFFEQDTSDYYEITDEDFSFEKKWLKEGTICYVTFWNEKIIELKMPKFVELKILSTNDIKKDLGTHKNFKYAITETNTSIKVPIFIKENDIIKIDTTTDTYISRITA